MFLFREAKNNNSFFYKFLCYYKMLEGGIKKVKPALNKNAKKNNIMLPQIDNKIPDIEFIRLYKPDLVGKKITRVFDNFFHPKFRNAVAHLKDEKDTHLNLYSRKQAYESVHPVIEKCAIIYIKNLSIQFDFYKRELIRINKQKDKNSDKTHNQ